MLARIDISENLFLSPPDSGDIAAFVFWLNDKDIYDRTLMIPFPYTEADAVYFLEYSYEHAQKYGVYINWAIRLADGTLIGGIGVTNLHPMKPHVGEVGYWLAKPYRGQGIMPLVLSVYCRFLQEQMGLLRIEAPIYAYNTASQRVLEKCGFTEEGYLRKAYFKNEQYLDGKLFALVI